MPPSAAPLVAVLMGSRSDWETMRAAADTLAEFDVPHETRALSAHRVPDLLSAYLRDAESRGVEVFIAGAGGAAHLPGVIASQTLRPVFGVPLMGAALNGLDALLAIVQMPAGIPVGTLAVGRAGAVNAALLAVAVLAAARPPLMDALRAYRERQRKIYVEQPDPRDAP